MNPRLSTVVTIYAATITLLFAVAVIAGFAPVPSDERHRFTEIDVERINIIEPDGTIKLVISNSKRQTEATISGETLPIERERPAGMIFFNDDGDEVGGLVFGGNQNEGSVGLMMDQFKQDQVLAFLHQEFTAADGQRHRMSGLMAWDRPWDTTIIDTVRLMEEVEAIEDPQERMARMQALHEEGAFGTQRMFVGRTMDGDSGMVMKDGRGRPRLLMSVSHDGEALIQFFDEDGEIVRTIGANDEQHPEE